MSLNRLNNLLMSDIIPFNFGMDYDACLQFYDANHETMSELCPTDPQTWSQGTVDLVNQRAKEQHELVDRLMLLPDDEFYAEVDRLRELNRTKSDNDE